MKYFIDTEFHEGFHKPLFGRRRHFIDLISIGIYAEDGRQYYAISSDFDIDAVWNAHDVKTNPYDFRNRTRSGVSTYKEYWLRDNVLMPIFYDLAMEDFHLTHFKDEWTKQGKGITLQTFKDDPVWSRDLRWFKGLLRKHGKPNHQIAQDIEKFVHQEKRDVKTFSPDAKFYGYYADYDWVVFCSLFGRMIDLPKGFPMYCRDLKQMFDEKVGGLLMPDITTDLKMKMIKGSPDYPQNPAEHNALADAHWNHSLYQFILSMDDLYYH